MKRCTKRYMQRTISYIWQVNKGSNWQNIYSDGSAALEVNEVNDNDIGSYRCFVSSEFGEVTSNSATLSFGDLDGIDPVDFKDFAILAASEPSLPILSAQPSTHIITNNANNSLCIFILK
jgi:hypothetical protein